MRGFRLLPWMWLPLALALVAPRTAGAQEPPAPAPAPVPAPAPAPGPAPGYEAPGSGQPGYGQPGWSPGFGAPYGSTRRYGGYDPPEGPPPPPVDRPPACCRWSVRFDPFDLIQRRMTFQAEVAIWGPIAVQVSPTWIFGSPYGGIDKKGLAIAGDAVFYLSGHAFHGWWLKAHGEYENFSATIANPNDPAATPTLVSKPQRFGSGVFGGLFGSTLVFGKNGGFTLSGGIGVGVATAPTTSIIAPGDPKKGIPPVKDTLYDGFDRIRLLGSIALGVAF